MKRLIFAAALAAGALAGIILWQTARFPSRQLQVRPAPSFPLDSAAMARRLSSAIQIETLSGVSSNGEKAAAWREMHEFLLRSFPRLHASLVREVVNRHSLLYTWPGKKPDLPPMLLAAHMDVAPVASDSWNQWTHPPFSGRIAEGFIWGRGAMDNKVGVLGILEAVEHLLAQGFQPQRTVYFAFGHDEESGGQQGAAKIAALLGDRHVKLAFALDEGGTVTDGIVPGTNRPVALIGIAEKGYLSLELIAQSTGGHASMPPSETAIGILSGALNKLEASPPPARLTAATRQMFQFIGPEMSWPTKTIVANPWLFGSIIRWQLDRSTATRATVRTTIAPTIFQAGVMENILPTRARAVVNLRLLPGDTVRDATAYVRQTIADPRVAITPLTNASEPSPVSDVASEGFTVVQKTIHQIVPSAIVAPLLLIAATDARHYAPLASDVYRFLPITLQPRDIERLHGVDERISLEDYERCVRFYIQLIRNADRSKSSIRSTAGE